MTIIQRQSFYFFYPIVGSALNPNNCFYWTNYFLIHNLIQRNILLHHKGLFECAA